MKSNDRTNYIYIYNNYNFNLQKPGTKIHIKCLIPDVSNNKYNFKNNSTYYSNDNLEKYKNRIILSNGILGEKGGNAFTFPVTL